MLIGGLALATFAAPAGAATGPTIDPAVKANASDTALATLRADGAAAIARRQTQLSTLSAKIAARPACDAGGAQAALVNHDTGALATLGDKLAADTTVATAHDDVKSILQDYRVYLVVAPQVFSTSACGHIRAATDRLTDIQTKLTAKVDAAAAGGADMTAAQASLSDMAAKMASARNAGDAAASSLAAIGPDHGDASVLASNQAAVASARSQLKGARTDLTTAVTDAKSVVAALKALPAN